MKAVILKEIGSPENLQFTDVDVPNVSDGEVLIKLKYAALNRRDVWITYGQYPKINLPTILGSDGAGVIVAIGSGVGNFKEGDEVIINPSLDWGDNINHYSEKHSILGMPRNGTYAEYVAVPAENVFRKPQYLKWDEAAAIPLGSLTAYRALFTRGNLQKGDNVFIPGIGGGVALSALQMAVAEGANVYVSSSSNRKLTKAKELGALGGVNYLDDSWVDNLLEMTKGGADIIIDSIGGSYFNDFIKIAKPNGRIVSFGATAGVVPRLVMPKIFFKHLQILGTTMGSPVEFAKMLEFYSNYEIRPVIDEVFPLADAITAQKWMEHGEGFGKIVLKISDN